MLEVTSANQEFFADIRLFHVESNGGTLKEDPQVQGRYGPSYIWPAFLYGFSSDGSKLYDTSTLPTGAVYRQRTIDLKTGSLGKDAEFFSAGAENGVVIGKKIIINQYPNDSDVKQSYVDILPGTPNPRRPWIHCTYAMLRYCATATNIQLDHYGQYLFLTDPATNAVHIAFINLSTRRVTDTGNSMPMTAQTPGFAFSPDGGIVYALLASDSSLHFFHFNPATGALSEGGTPLPLAFGAGFCPAQYH